MEVLKNIGRFLRGVEVSGEKTGLEEQYRSIVEEAYKEDKEMNIRCSSPEHAKYVSRLLLDGAERDVRIFQGTSEEIFYEDEEIAEAFENAIGKGVEIGILLQNNADEEFERFCDRKDIPFRDGVQPESEISHSLLVDGVSYRLERPHDPEDLKKGEYPEAIANFNNEDWGNRIKRGYLKLLYY